eukprot:2211507-Pyramimonas_sp.AAC.1
MYASFISDRAHFFFLPWQCFAAQRLHASCDGGQPLGHPVKGADLTVCEPHCRFGYAPARLRGVPTTEQLSLRAGDLLRGRLTSAA